VPTESPSPSPSPDSSPIATSPSPTTQPVAAQAASNPDDLGAWIQRILVFALIVLVIGIAVWGLFILRR